MLIYGFALFHEIKKMTSPKIIIWLLQLGSILQFAIGICNGITLNLFKSQKKDYISIYLLMEVNLTPFGILISPTQWLSFYSESPLLCSTYSERLESALRKEIWSQEKTTTESDYLPMFSKNITFFSAIPINLSLMLICCLFSIFYLIICISEFTL